MMLYVSGATHLNYAIYQDLGKQYNRNYQLINRRS